VAVPSNFLGNEQAHGGTAYAGFQARPPNPYREYVEGVLSPPLAAGNTYQVSFYVSLADRSRWAVDEIGAYLATAAVGPVNTVYVIPGPPQVNANNHVTNQSGWTQVAGTYVATGGEDHIVIGNFFDNASTVPLPVGGSDDFAYYYLDDVSVTLSALPCTPTPTGGNPTPTDTP